VRQAVDRCGVALDIALWEPLQACKVEAHTHTHAKTDGGAIWSCLRDLFAIVFIAL
jgi:hypothetical protein